MQNELRAAVCADCSIIAVRTKITADYGASVKAGTTPPSARSTL